MFLLFWIFIQIIIESLPISSSGHVALVSRIAQKYTTLSFDQTSFWIVDFLLHGPTIIILFVYFLKPWWQMVFKNKSWKELLSKSSLSDVVKPVVFIACADSVTILFWWADFAHMSFFQNYFLTIGFMCTALLLHCTKWCKGNKNVTWSLRDGFILGVAQAVSLLPGISRFACTFATGRFRGYSGTDSFALSFLIQMPLLCAGFLKGLIALQKDVDLAGKLFAFPALAAMVIASLISFGCLYGVGQIIKQNKLHLAARYMIFPILISLIV